MNHLTIRRARSAPVLISALVSALYGSAVNASEDWEFSLSPLFLWAVSVDGETTVNGTGSPLHLDFRDDLLESLEASFTVQFEAHRGQLGFFAEYQYSDLNFDVSGTAGPIALDGDVGFEEVLAELGATWTFIENDRSRVELLGGARYHDQDIDADLNLSTPALDGSLTRRAESGDDWLTGIVGLRFFHDISDNWTFSARGDYGYGGNDNSAVNATILLDYRFADWGSAFFGARYLAEDYRQGVQTGYGYDAYKLGPALGIRIHW